jgi:hypothetical protein
MTHPPGVMVAPEPGGGGHSITAKVPASLINSLPEFGNLPQWLVSFSVGGYNKGAIGWHGWGFGSNASPFCWGPLSWAQGGQGGWAHRRNIWWWVWWLRLQGMVDLKFLFFYFAVNQNSHMSLGLHENIARQAGRCPRCTRSQCKETGLDDLDPRLCLSHRRQWLGPACPL